MTVLSKVRHLITALMVTGIFAGPLSAQISRPADGVGIGGGGEGASVPEPNPGAATPPRIPGSTTPPPVPPPVTPAKPIAYFVVINGQQAGPFNAEQLKAKVASGELVRTSLVWTEGMQDWEEAIKVADLAPILASTPPKPKFDAVAYLAGTWQNDPQQIQIPNVGPGTANSRTTYRRDGTYSYLSTIDVMMQGYPVRQTITSEGTFTAKEQGPGQVLVTPNGMTTFSIPGEPSQTVANNTPFVLTVMDENTLVDNAGVRAQRVGG
ncbi:DUF4339 domain-containing protein [Oceaniglobus ichthyenteri]|uniref:DUF4339 domain-containing protein n=1 Tax=Oceaniglobus ichthyenteri TaxID=2136177 RepID=UPI000D392E65|nr:DUF4339 domain-containing protein [Oceaniglobus ichthyenteri]